MYDEQIAKEKKNKSYKNLRILKRPKKRKKNVNMCVKYRKVKYVHAYIDIFCFYHEEKKENFAVDLTIITENKCPHTNIQKFVYTHRTMRGRGGGRGKRKREKRINNSKGRKEKEVIYMNPNMRRKINK